MPAPESLRVAEFLATHSLLLLALGVACALLAVTIIAVTVPILQLLQRPIRRVVTSSITYAQGIGVLPHVVVPTSTLISSGYILLHLTLGLIAVIATMAFVIIGEQA